MDITKLTYDPKIIKKALYKTDDNQLITNKPVKLYFPYDYLNKGLAIMSTEMTVVATFMIVVDDKYWGKSLVPSMFKTKPDAITTIQIKGREFFELSYSAGSTLMLSTLLVKQKKFSNAIFEYFIDYGNTPFFMHYIEHCSYLAKCKYYNDLSLAKSQVPLDVICSVIARDPNNVKKYYRHYITKDSQQYEVPQFIPLRDIGLNANSNLARLNGSELKRGIRAALLSDDLHAETLESMLIK